MNPIVFIIWIGNAIPQKYIPRIQSIFIDAHIMGYKCVIYTDNVFRMTKTLVMSVVSILPIIEIRSIYSLIKISEDLEYQCAYRPQNTSKYFKISAPLSDWPRYGLIRFLINKRFYARVSLNLRLIALNLHGGIYLDADCMNVYYRDLYKMWEEYNKWFYIYKQLIRYKTNMIVKHFRRFEYQYLHDILPGPTGKKKWDINTCLSDIDIYLASPRCLYKTWITTRNTRTSDRIISNKLEAITFGPTTSHGKNISQCILRLQTPGILTNKLIVYYQFINLVSRIQSNYAYISDVVSSVVYSPQTDLPNIFDIIFTRKLYPYYVNSTDGLKITYRKGIFHPLGKAVTRGGWEFIKKQKLKSANENGVEFDFGEIYPESSVIEGDYKNNPSHWTKQYY
jgi:hypothetical protein